MCLIRKRREAIYISITSVNSAKKDSRQFYQAADCLFYVSYIRVYFVRVAVSGLFCCVVKRWLRIAEGRLLIWGGCSRRRRNPG